ncbi:MAG: hypothetical protein GTO46_14220 [Gemmatimonadetes bacterium]|nr:hypothetical protein [Gemmatimonadota bacterium]NIO32749.1 hypothetical protein [Gemmatimonadota bacterium]
MKWRELTFKVIGGALIVALLAWFAYANSDQSVDIKLGLFTLRGISLPVLVYGSVVLGMLLMIAVGLRNDVRTRQALDRYDKIAADVLQDIDDPGREKEEVLEETGEVP